MEDKQFQSESVDNYDMPQKLPELLSMKYSFPGPKIQRQTFQDWWENMIRNPKSPRQENYTSGNLTTLAHLVAILSVLDMVA